MNQIHTADLSAILALWRIENNLAAAVGGVRVWWEKTRFPTACWGENMPDTSFLSS